MNTKTTSQERQTKSSNNDEERLCRQEEIRDFIDGIVGRHAEHFADPDSRLAYVRETDAQDFLRLARYVNANMRGESWGILRHDDEQGGYLPMIHTPAAEDKIQAFTSGYRAIQEYVTESDDSTERKLLGVGMAVEALVIWTHPFNDGNGRTSRFLARFIESGPEDAETLVAESVSNLTRQTYYKKTIQVQGDLLDAARDIDEPNDNIFGVISDDDDPDAAKRLREQAKTLPDDIQGMYLNIKDLLIRIDQVNEVVVSRRERFAPKKVA